jgi:very-short-patch-repair endonuclease
MRGELTRSEAALWARLSGSRLGVGFRRQHVIGKYIVDFAAPKARLVVEVEGGYHVGRARKDATRDARLARAGWRVVRVASEAAVEEAVASVVAAIAAVGSPGRSRAVLPLQKEPYVPRVSQPFA